MEHINVCSRCGKGFAQCECFRVNAAELAPLPVGKFDDRTAAEQAAAERGNIVNQHQHIPGLVYPELCRLCGKAVCGPVEVTCGGGAYDTFTCVLTEQHAGEHDFAGADR